MRLCFITLQAACQICVLIPVCRAGFHVDEFPEMTVQILEAVLIHEAVVFGLSARRPTGSDGLANQIIMSREAIIGI